DALLDLDGVGPLLVTVTDPAGAAGENLPGSLPLLREVPTRGQPGSAAVHRVGIGSALGGEGFLLFAGVECRAVRGGLLLRGCLPGGGHGVDDDQNRDRDQYGYGIQAPPVRRRQPPQLRTRRAARPAPPRGGATLRRGHIRPPLCAQRLIPGDVGTIRLGILRRFVSRIHVYSLPQSHRRIGSESPVRPLATPVITLLRRLATSGVPLAPPARVVPSVPRVRRPPAVTTSPAAGRVSWGPLGWRIRACPAPPRRREWAPSPVARSPRASPGRNVTRSGRYLWCYAPSPSRPRADARRPRVPRPSRRTAVGATYSVLRNTARSSCGRGPTDRVGPDCGAPIRQPREDRPTAVSGRRVDVGRAYDPAWQVRQASGYAPNRVCGRPSATRSYPPSSSPRDVSERSSIARCTVRALAHAR